MSAPPAHPKTSQVYAERAAYLKLVQGKLTAEQYLAAIAPARKKRGRRRARH